MRNLLTLAFLSVAAAFAQAPTGSPSVPRMSAYLTIPDPTTGVNPSATAADYHWLYLDWPFQAYKDAGGFWHLKIADSLLCFPVQAEYASLGNEGRMTFDLASDSPLNTFIPPAVYVNGSLLLMDGSTMPADGTASINGTVVTLNGTWPDPKTVVIRFCRTKPSFAIAASPLP